MEHAFCAYALSAYFGGLTPHLFVPDEAHQGRFHAADFIENLSVSEPFKRRAKVLDKVLCMLLRVMEAQHIKQADHLFAGVNVAQMHSDISIYHSEKSGTLRAYMPV